MKYVVLATIATITEKIIFVYFHANHCYGHKLFHDNYTAYQSKLKTAATVFLLPHC